MMVATGRAELMVDPVMAVWDAAALQPILEEAAAHSPTGKAVRIFKPAKGSPRTGCCSMKCSRWLAVDNNFVHAAGNRHLPAGEKCGLVASSTS